MRQVADVVFNWKKGENAKAAFVSELLLNLLSPRSRHRMTAAEILVILTLCWERAALCLTAICAGLNVVCVLFVQNSVTDQ